jgi:anti-anti-sigma factor
MIQGEVMLKIHAKKLGKVTILCLQGRIGAGETTTLRDAVLSQSDVSVIVLDLARVSGIDAGGLGVMLELREQTQAKGIAFRLRNITKLVQQVFEITRLNSVFETFSEEEVVSEASRARLTSVLEVAPCA